MRVRNAAVLRQRDAVVWRHLLEKNDAQHQYTVVWVSCTHPEYVPDPKVIRISSNGCYRILQNKDCVDIYSLADTDLGGAIPMAMIRMASVPSLIAFRRKLEEACRR